MEDKDFTIRNGVLTIYKGKSSHVVIPNNVKVIDSYAFSDCTGMTSIEIPNSVTSISYSAFYGCENLTSIKIPNSVKIIGSSAFYGCENLTSIKIPNSVTKIGELAFYGCENLASINIPDSITFIDYSAFEGIKKVKPQYKSNGTLRAFKGFHSDWTCRGFKYKIGKSYHQDGNIKCCENGFHACPNPLDVFNYYNGKLNNLRFAEVELSGEMDWKEDKVAASDIRIVRELTLSELAEIYNSMEKEI